MLKPLNSFVFAEHNQVLWPVYVHQPADGGKTVTSTINICFIVPDEVSISALKDKLTELATTRAQSTDGAGDATDAYLADMVATREIADYTKVYISKHIVGWEDGAITDQDGNNIDYSPNMLNALMQNIYFKQACDVALKDITNTATVKNSKPSSTGIRGQKGARATA